LTANGWISTGVQFDLTSLMKASTSAINLWVFVDVVGKAFARQDHHVVILQLREVVSERRRGRKHGRVRETKAPAATRQVDVTPGCPPRRRCDRQTNDALRRGRSVDVVPFASPGQIATRGHGTGIGSRRRPSVQAPRLAPPSIF
jgi:hypothetical protein